MKQQTIKINKKGFLARDFLIGLILFSMIFLLAFIMAKSAGDSYGIVTTDAEFSQRYDNLQNMTDISSDMFTNVSSGGGLKLVGTFNSIFSATFKVIALILGSVSLSSRIIANGAVDLGIPNTIAYPVAEIITGSIVAIITIIIVLGIVSLLSRGRI